MAVIGARGKRLESNFLLASPELFRTVEAERKGLKL
jgi:hypothetical protein